MNYQTDAPNRFDRLFPQIPEETWILIAAAVILSILLISLIAYALGVIGQGGLIGAFHRIDGGTPVTLREAFSFGAGRFWRLFGVQLLIGLLTLVAILLLVLPAMGFTVLTFGLGMLCLLPLICLLIPLSLALEIYVLVAQISIVVEDLRVAEALRRAWGILRQNLGPALVMGLILGVGRWLLGVLLALPLIPVFVPLFVAIAASQGEFPTTGVALAGACLVIYLPLLIVASGVIQTFVTGSWTLTYQRMIERPTAGQAGTPA
jgi:hypothetical protein